jgi:hypothetical protein
MKAAGAVLLVLLFSLSAGASVAQAQRFGPEPDTTAQDPFEQEDRPFIDGIRFGVGVNAYFGDMDSNPNDNILKHLGSGNANLMFGVDKRFGQFEQYGVSAVLYYDRIRGQQDVRQGFTNNLISLDIGGSYELPVVRQGLFRVFGSVGPTLLLAPSYECFPPETAEDSVSDECRVRGRSATPQTEISSELPGTDWEELGTRVTGSATLGVTLIDRIRLGTRFAFTDYLDGHTGLNGGGSFDMLFFVNIGYRINRRSYD